MREISKEDFDKEYLDVQRAITNKYRRGDPHMNIRNCHMKNIKLVGYDLSYIDLTDSLLENVEFIECRLRVSVFAGAKLVACKFIDSNFRGSSFSLATFMCCDCCCCDFSNGYFDSTIFKASNFERCSWSNADFTDGSNLPENIPMACPAVGSFVGYKKCVSRMCREVIVKLEIPANAKRSSGTGKKCRCDKAKVIQIETLAGEVLKKNIYAYSSFDSNFKYKVGEIVTPKEKYDNNRFNECSSGIHFFLNRDDAVIYSI